MKNETGPLCAVRWLCGGCRQTCLHATRSVSAREGSPPRDHMQIDSPDLHTLAWSGRPDDATVLPRKRDSRFPPFRSNRKTRIGSLPIILSAPEFPLDSLHKRSLHFQIQYNDGQRSETSFLLKFLGKLPSVVDRKAIILSRMLYLPLSYAFIIACPVHIFEGVVWRR